MLIKKKQGESAVTKTKLSLITSVAPMFALLMPTTVFAQNAPVDDEAGIADIVVTAQRREENLQNVPLSVSAFSAEQLKEQGTNDISRLEGIVPGFSFGRSGTDARPAMRGVRTENAGVNGDTTIGLFIDGVYMSRASQGTLGFVDIDRVEVLRGPQGTLYGRNTFGGNISISSALPTFDEYKGGVDLTVGQNGRYRGEGFVNAPLSDTVALRIAGAFEESNGYVKNDGLGSNLFDDKSRYIRGTVLLKPSDRLTAALKFDYSRQGGAGGSAFGYKLRGSYYDVGSNQQLYNGTPIGINPRIGPVNRDGIVDAPLTIDAGVPIYRPNDPYRINTDEPTVLNLRNYGLSANIAYDLGAVTVKSITGYTDFIATRTADSDFGQNTVAVDSQLTAAKTFSQELQLLSSGDGPFTYVVGGYYFKDKLQGITIQEQRPAIIRDVTPNTTTSTFRGGFYDQQRARTKSLAAYAQASYALTDKLKLTAGVRHTVDTKNFAFATERSVVPLIGGTTPDSTFIRLGIPAVPDSAFGSVGSVTNCTFVTPTPRPGIQCLAANTALITGGTYTPKKFKKTTWRVGVDYQVADDNLLYAAVSTGFRSGGFNSSSSFGINNLILAPTFAPETVTAFEVGSKNRFADNSIQLNIAAFYNRYSNLQEQRQVPAGPATLSIIENSGKARSYGAEVEAIWKPSSAFTLGTSFSYLNAEYTNYTNVPAPFGTSILVNAPLVNGLPAPATVVGGVEIAPAGRQRVFAPGYNCGLVPGTGGTGQPGAAFGCDLTGNKIPHSPEFSGSVYASYDIDIGSAGTLTPFAIVTHSASFFGQPFNSILEKQNSFTKIDLRLTWALNDKFEVQGFVTNLTDKATATRFVWGGGGALQASYAPPRLWGARASFKF
jgi:iron complex outermembrane recepter protein